MSSQYKKVKRFTGVYYSESKVNQWRGSPDRSYWVVFNNSKTGKTLWEKCGKASEGWTPEAAQRKRYELLEKEGAGKYKPKSQRRKNATTFGDFIEKQYLPWADDNKKRPQDDYSRYKSWIKEYLSDKPLNKISSQHIEQIKKDMKSIGRADATIKQVISLIRHVFNKAIEWGHWEGVNPCKGIKLPRLNNARQRFLSYEEADQLLNALNKQNYQLAQIATLSLYGGLRLGEVLNLRWVDIDRNNDIIFIRDSKSNESRPIFITEPVKNVLDELIPGQPEEPLFANRFGKPIGWLSKAFGTVVDGIGLNKGITDRRNKVTFHTLRHTYASWAVMSGVPLYVVGKALGHRTLDMTQRYSHLAPDSQREAFEAVAQYSKGK
ncbi:tyrosine-type recombinase/integrase [Thermodesulfobacteriota bacterium]